MSAMPSSDAEFASFHDQGGCHGGYPGGDRVAGLRRRSQPADKIYKGQKIILHGTFGGSRPDPADAKIYLVT